LFDTDDDGKVNVLDMGAGMVKTDSGGNVSAAVAGTGGDYLSPAAGEINGFTSKATPVCICSTRTTMGRLISSTTFRALAFRK
jgi:hypothetical protein